jgi:hypothetical protein
LTKEIPNPNDERPAFNAGVPPYRLWPTFKADRTLIWEFVILSSFAIRHLGLAESKSIFRQKSMDAARCSRVSPPMP